MPIPAFNYRLTPPTPRRRRFVPAILTEWHRAALLGVAVDHLEIDGTPCTPKELERLNLWIAAGGAWRCSLLQWHVAEAVLRGVLSGRLNNVKVGPNGAGRWSSRATFEEIVRDRGEGSQGTFWPQIGETG